MLFLLKRTWRAALAGFVLLTLLGLALRQVAPAPLELTISLADVGWGAVVVGCVLISDGTIHGLLTLLAGERYQRRYRELAGLFRSQTFAAILLGSLMAGVGEELCFRSLDGGAIYLFSSAVVFGLLHHINRSLVLITIWSVWQGVLFATAMLMFQRLGVTMTAHFLHDFVGFLIFRLYCR